MFFAILTSVMLASADVSLELERGVPCLELAKLSSRLAARGIGVQATSSNRVLVGAKGSTVVLSGQSHGRTLKRDVATEGEGCAAVERVVLTLIAAWVKSEGIAPVPTAVPTTAIPVKEKEKERVEEPMARPQIEISSGSMHLEAREPVPEVPQPFDAGVEVVQSTAGLDAGTAESVPLPDPLPAGRGIDFAVLGGAALGPSVPVASGMVTVGFHLGLFGARIDGGFQSARSTAVDMTTITAAMQWVTVSARVSLPLHERVKLDFTVGLRGTRIAADSTGATTSAPQVLLALGGAASIAARFRLLGPLFAQLEINGGARGQSERLFIAGTTNVLNLTPFEFQALGGLGLDFDLLRD